MKKNKKVYTPNVYNQWLELFRKNLKEKKMNIKSDMRRLNNIANAYHKTGGEVREMWKKKWYELVKVISTKLKRTIH